MAVENGEIRYATSLGTTDVPRGWTERKLDGGVLIDVPSGRIVSHGLCMPHSPRLIGDDLYLVEAGTGTLFRIDRSSGARTPVVVGLPGFARGLAEHGGYLFVGLSLMRGSRPFEGLPVEHGGKEVICGVVAIELATGQVVGTRAWSASPTSETPARLATSVLMGRSKWVSLAGMAVQARCATLAAAPRSMIFR